MNAVDELLKSLATQVPNLAALGVIVAFFLKHIARSDERLSGLGDACHQVQARAIDAIVENTKALTKLVVVVEELSPENDHE